MPPAVKPTAPPNRVPRPQNSPPQSLSAIAPTINPAARPPPANPRRRPTLRPPRPSPYALWMVGGVTKKLMIPTAAGQPDCASIPPTISAIVAASLAMTSGIADGGRSATGDATGVAPGGTNRGSPGCAWATAATATLATIDNDETSHRMAMLCQQPA